MFVKGAGANQPQLDHTMVFKDKDHTLGKGYRPLLALLSGPCHCASQASGGRAQAGGAANHPVFCRGYTSVQPVFAVK